MRIQSISHIVSTPNLLNGRPRIDGHRISVSDVVNLHVRLNAPIAEIAEDYSLSLAQIHAALAYYYDHRTEIDADLDEEYRLAEQQRDDSSLRRETLLAQARERRPALYEQLIAAREHDPDRDMTVAEIHETYGVSAQAVREAAAKGWIAARKSGNTWLIRRRDAEARWGASD